MISSHSCFLRCRSSPAKYLCLSPCICMCPISPASQNPSFQSQSVTNASRNFMRPPRKCSRCATRNILTSFPLASIVAQIRPTAVEEFVATLEISFAVPVNWIRNAYSFQYQICTPPGVVRYESLRCEIGTDRSHPIAAAMSPDMFIQTCTAELHVCEIANLVRGCFDSARDRVCDENRLRYI